jgi:hypothetical protein
VEPARLSEAGPRGARKRHYRKRGAGDQDHVGVLQGLRSSGSQAWIAGRASLRRSCGRVAQPAAVRVDAPRGHHPPGRLVVESAPDPAVAQGLRRGRGRRRAAFQLRGRRPPQAAHRRAQCRLAGLLPGLRSGADGSGLRGVRRRLRRHPPVAPRRHRGLHSRGLCRRRAQDAPPGRRALGGVGPSVQ